MTIENSAISSPIDPASGGYLIVASSTKDQCQHLEKMRTLVEQFLKEKNIESPKEYGKDFWRVRVEDQPTALEVSGRMMEHHSYLHTRQLGVEVYVMENSSDPRVRNRAIQIGVRPPTSNTLKTNEEVYFQQYLGDHSLAKTRRVHMLATVAGVATAVYGLYSGNYWLVPLGVGSIYEAGFHSHLFVERNIPSSTKYPKGSVYSDLRVTLQTILNPLTGGMDKDLEKAGIYDVSKDVKKVANKED